MIALLLPLTLYGQTGFAPDSTLPALTVILREGPSLEDSKFLQAASNKQREEFFLAKHFVKVEKGTHVYLYPSEVWKEVELKAKTEAMQQVLASGDSHGEINAFASPALVAVMGESLSSLKLDVGPDTVLAVNHQTTCTLYKDGRSVDLFLPSSSPVDSLKAHPFVTSQDPTTQAKIPRSQSLGKFFLYDCGPQFDSDAARDRDLAGAMLILADHLQPLEEKFNQAKNALIKKLTGDDLKNLVKVAPEEIGAWTLGEVRQQLKNSWKAYGFTDAASAQDFLSGCRISTFNHLYASGSGGGTMSYSIQFD